MNLFLFALASVGLTHILVDSALLEPIRNKIDAWFPEKISYMIHCYQCSGFWSGLICGCVFFDGWQILMAAFAGSFLSNFAASILAYLEAKAIIDMDTK